MGASYTIFGRQVGGHYIAIGILASMFGGIGYGVSGGKPAGANNTPPINASSSDEADFIKKFMAEADKKN